jgi:hypothetical protein
VRRGLNNYIICRACLALKSKVTIVELRANNGLFYSLTTIK